MGAHSLAETYNTLTRFSGYRLPSADAVLIIEQASQVYTIVTLNAEQTLRAIHDAAGAGIAGPVIYDALLIACARKIDAKTIYTFNVKHFRQIAPDLAGRIVAP